MFIGLVIVMRLMFSVDTRPFEYVSESNYQYDIKNIHKNKKKEFEFKKQRDGRFKYHSDEKKQAIAKILFNASEVVTFSFEIEKSCLKCERNLDKSGLTTIAVVLNNDTLLSDTVSKFSPKEVEVSVILGDEVQIHIGSARYSSEDTTYLTLSHFNIWAYVVPWVIPFFFTFFVWHLAQRKMWLFVILSPLLLGLLFASESMNVGWPTIESGLFYLLLIGTYVGLSVIATFLLSKLPAIGRGVVQALLLIVVFLLPLVYYLYNVYFGVAVEKNVFWALFQSNYFESVEFAESIFTGMWFVLALMVFVSFCILFYLYERRSRLQVNIIHLSALLLFGLTLLFVQSNHYPFWRLISDSFEEYQKELSTFINMKNDRKQQLSKLKVELHHDDEMFVFVVGESLFKGHMSLYGYPRKTNPLLEAFAQADSNFLIFDNTWANFVSTMESMSMVLTEADQYHAKNYIESYSVLDVIKQAGIHTSWITNQRLNGKSDNIVAVLATDADDIIALNTNRGTANVENYYDSIVVKPTREAIEKKNGFVVTHLLGNHFGYSNRYPKWYNKYKDDLPMGIFGDKNTEYDAGHLNHYDNSVLYNDSIVETILQKLKEKNQPSIFIYMADHGEEVFNKNQHNSSVYSPEMVSIPFVVWMSPEYVGRYPERAGVLKENRSRMFTNDLMFHTILGFMPVTTDLYDSTLDIGHLAYSLTDKSAETMHGQQDIDDGDNYIYWRQKNRKLLANSFVNSSVVCTDVYTKGSIAWAARDSIDGIEFHVHKKNSNLIVGDRRKSINYQLSSLVKDENLEGVKSMWIHVEDSTIILDSILTMISNSYKTHMIDSLYVMSDNSTFEKFSYKKLKYNVTDTIPAVYSNWDNDVNTTHSFFGTNISINDSKLVDELQKKGVNPLASYAIGLKCPDYFH